ncbi:hypothetical protein BG015_002793 [Linnemannia schmuckeri]|uniref:Uncharacterized protein n=1 Tax=Linnemannia schmuckeri TaxID=64567 RepID=A0A9P5S5G6_9FUNG|nr:hypothetical protein BG015_002793 [Linnemannia schmuckeri]
MASTAGVASAAKRTLSAVVRILSPSAPAPIIPVKASFRPQPTSTTTTAAASPASVTQEPSSISGLKFCLHMVLFAAPGIVLSKRLADGERVEDMVEEAKTTFNSLVNSLS